MNDSHHATKHTAPHGSQKQNKASHGLESRIENNDPAHFVIISDQRHTAMSVKTIKFAHGAVKANAALALIDTLLGELSHGIMVL